MTRTARFLLSLRARDCGKSFWLEGAGGGPTVTSVETQQALARRLASGNRMVGEGALVAGCRFFAGYPITPASEIYEVMMRELPARGGLAGSLFPYLHTLHTTHGHSTAFAAGRIRDTILEKKGGPR